MNARTLALCLVVALVPACARGSTPDDTGRGGGTPVGAGGSGGASSTASSTGGSGAAPASCAAANGNVGCCVGDTEYYCKTGSTTLVASTCATGKVCGWNASKGYYACVSPPGGADPSGQYPIDCP